MGSARVPAVRAVSRKTNSPTQPSNDMKTPRFVLGLALVAIALAQSGCVSLINKIQSSKFFADQPTLYSPAPFVLHKDQKAEGLSLQTLFDKAFLAAERNPSDATSCNTLLYAGIALIDFNYRRYVDAATQGRATFETASDITSIGLSTASTLMDPTGTKTILSGLSTAVQGSKASVEKNFYQDITTFVFISRMDAERAKVLKEITGQNAVADGKTPAALTFGAVMVYLGQYYQAGTTLNALTKAQAADELSQKYEEVKASTESLKKELEALKSPETEATNPPKNQS